MLWFRNSESESDWMHFSPISRSISPRARATHLSLAERLAASTVHHSTASHLGMQWGDISCVVRVLKDPSLRFISPSKNVAESAEKSTGIIDATTCMQWQSAITTITQSSTLHSLHNMTFA